jgi:hypothetical protein
MNAQCSSVPLGACIQLIEAIGQLFFQRREPLAGVSSMDASRPGGDHCHSGSYLLIPILVKLDHLQLPVEVQSVGQYPPVF